MESKPQFTRSFLEDGYEKFLKRHPEAYIPSVADFLGINLYNDARQSVTYKIYYATHQSESMQIPFLRPLYDLHMIRALNAVSDTVNQSKIRCEVGLCNRTNDNIRRLFDWLDEIYSFNETERNEIALFSRLRCSDLPRYLFSALYFLGIIARVENHQITDTYAVKLHYILRHCKNPEQLAKSYEIDNTAILRQLASLGIPEIEHLTEVVAALTEIPGVKLWIAAVDFYKNEERKYKIYLNNLTSDICVPLANLLKVHDLEFLPGYIGGYQKWLSRHPELNLYGLALCISSRRTWSVNFYHNALPKISV